MPDPKYPFPDDVPDMQLPSREPKPPAAQSSSAGDGYAAEGGPPATAKWKKGDRVLAPWEPTYLYAGTIEKIEAARALIEFDDGDSGWVKLIHVQPLQLKRGQEVLCRRRMGPHFLPAEIREVNGEDVRVEFVDGVEERTTVAAVRVPCQPQGTGAEQIEVRSHTAFLKHLRSGDRVWALWNNQALFVGTVGEMRDDDAHIRFDDGDQAWVRLEHLLPLDLLPGMFVMGRWQMGGSFYPGTITKVQGERVHIRYDDGDQEWTTPAALALPLGPPPAAPGAPPPNAASTARPNSGAPARPHPADADNDVEVGWNPRLVLVVGGVALTAVALIFYWLGSR
jgi:hypothetical protein